MATDTQTFVDALQASGSKAGALRIRGNAGTVSVNLTQLGTVTEPTPEVAISIAVGEILVLRLDRFAVASINGDVTIDKVAVTGISEAYKLMAATDDYRSLSIAPDYTAATGPNR